MQLHDAAGALTLTFFAGKKHRPLTLRRQHILDGPRCQPEHAAPLAENDHLAPAFKADPTNETPEFDELGRKQPLKLQLATRTPLRAATATALRTQFVPSRYRSCAVS